MFLLKIQMDLIDKVVGFVSGKDADIQLIKRIAKMQPAQQEEAANELLRELNKNFHPSDQAANALSKLAARSQEDLNNARAKFAKDLSNSTEALDPEEYQKVYQLMKIDLEHQLKIVEAQKAILEAKERIDRLETVTELLYVVYYISFDKDLLFLYATKSEYDLLKEADDLLNHLINGFGAPNALLTSIIRLTPNIERDLGFLLPGQCSPETKELYHRALARHLIEGDEEEDEDHFYNDIDSKYKKLLGKPKERRRQIALLDAKEQALKIELQKGQIPLLKQLKEKLEQKGLGKKQTDYPLTLQSRLQSAFDNPLDVLKGLFLLMAIAFFVFIVVLGIKNEFSRFQLRF